VFTDGFVRDYPLAIRHRSGTITDVLYNATVYRNEAGEVQGVFAAARDITDRKRAEEELQRYSGHLEAIVEERTAKLKDAERLAGIGETAAMIGHDLRNPLQGLQYIVDLQKLRAERVPLEKRGADEWQQEQVLFDRISEQVYYMDKIVGDLQDYARPITAEHELVKVSTLINDVLQSLPHADHVAITTDIPDLTLNADPHFMHRVFANLILNAIQAMSDGGTLTISASADDSSVAIHVHDTGVGIRGQMKSKLFSPLTTGKAKGTGLGLAVVKRIVEAHNGTITFESEEGKGTTFTVTLPRHA
jgi:signal transduction histidine kinase